MFLPEDIDGKEFSRTLGGYSPREVDDYLEQLKAEFERLISENGELRSEIEALGASAGAASAVDVTAEEAVEVSEAEEIEISEAEETEAESPVTDVGDAADDVDDADDVGVADVEADEEADTPDETFETPDEDTENTDSEPETIPIPLTPDDEYGEDEVPSADERSGEYVFETTGSESDDIDITNEPESETEEEAAPTDVTIDDGIDFGEAENAPGDIKFEDLEEGLLRMFGDWRDGGGSESAESAESAVEAEEGDEAEEDTSDRADAEDISGGVTAETDAAPETSPAPYKKRIYRMRKKHAADNDENDDDSDFALHEYDEYKYFFGDGKK